MLFVSSLVLIKRNAASGTNNYFRKRRKKGKAQLKIGLGPATYPHGLGTPKILGTGAHHISRLHGKIEGAVP